MQSIQFKEKADSYEIEYTPLDDYVFIRSFISDIVKNVLIVPCGNSRYIDALRDLTGCHITFADQEPIVIDKLKKRIVNECLTDRFETWCVRMQELLPQRAFDLIIIPQDAFQLLLPTEDIRATVTSLRRSLSPKGRVLIDISILNSKHQIVNTYTSKYINYKYGCVIFDWSRKVGPNKILNRFHKQVWCDSYVRFTFFYVERNLEYFIINRYKYTVDLKVYKKGDLESYLHPHGFKVQALFGGYDFQPFTSKSARIIYSISL